MRPCLGCGRLIRNGSRCHECAIPRPSNTAPWRATRRAVLARDDYRCARCGAYADHVDHVHPVSRGGWESPRGWRHRAPSRLEQLQCSQRASRFASAELPPTPGHCSQHPLRAHAPRLRGARGFLAGNCCAGGLCDHQLDAVRPCSQATARADAEIGGLMNAF